jgi:restriction endonuclease Mrr
MESLNYGIGLVTGRSGDEGIDGLINQDTLGVEKIFSGIYGKH